MHFGTKAIHTDFLKPDVHGAIQMPVYDSVAFEYESAEALEAAFTGREPGHLYSRITNPTVEHFEQKMKSLTHSLGVIALSSGMAAISNLILAIAGKDDTVVTTKHLFGNTLSLFEKTLKPWGLEVHFADFLDVASVENAIDEKTRAIYLETITNPQIEVADIEAIAKVAKSKGIPLIADTTMTPPYLFDSRKFGVDVEVLSSTKYISGGATSVGGLIIDNGTFNWGNNPNLKRKAKQFGPFALMGHLRREVYRNLGSCLSPHNAYLQSLGLETLTLRVQKSCDNTLTIAKYLEQHTKVKSVKYPGLLTSPYYEISKKQFANGSGGLLTFELDSKERCFEFMNQLNLIKRATNLNDNKTLIIHPASTIFAEYDADTRQTMGVKDTLIRLAVGIEEVEDIVQDLDQALEAV